MKLGICAFPLSRGRETGRGLERVVEEFCRYLDDNKTNYNFYESGIIRNEILAIVKSVSYFFKLLFSKDEVYFGIYPVAGIFPILAGKKRVVTAVHDLVPFSVFGYDNSLKYSLKRFCIKFACQKSSHLIVPFNSTKQEIVRLFGVPPDNISVYPYGVNHKNYFVDESIVKEELRIVFLGEAKRAKGMDTAILAFQQVLKTFPSAKLHLASNGSELEELKGLANDVLPSGSFQFVGFIPEDQMRKFYSTAKIFLFPSRYGFGLSSVEALACGTPSIVGATLDALDFFTDSDLVVDPEKPHELAEKICNLLNNDKMYTEKRTWGIKTAAKYSWGTMSQSYFERLVAERSRIGK